MDARHGARRDDGFLALEAPGPSRSEVLVGARDPRDPQDPQNPPSAATSTQAKRRKKPFPPVDEHLVVPEVTRDEMIKGRRVVDMAALPPHAEAQAGLSFLLRAHAAPGYIVASELLTRVSEGSDFATDVCIRKEGIDPETGRRYLEELSFEIINEQRMGLIRDKADELGKRGVRRIFAIFIKRGYVGEWSQKQRKFVELDRDAMFDDEALVRPLPFKVLLDQASAEDEAVHALVTKGNVEIVKIRNHGLHEGRQQGLDEGRQQGLDEGKLSGRRETLLELLEEQFGRVPKRWKERVRTANIEELKLWSKKLLASAAIDDVFETT